MTQDSLIVGIQVNINEEVETFHLQVTKIQQAKVYSPKIKVELDFLNLQRFKPLNLS